MHAELERLIALQRLDLASQDAERRLAEEPERRRAFEARLDGARTRVASAKEQLARSQNARRIVEKEVAVHQGRLSKFREQAMAVKTNQEYHAIQHEIAFAQTEIKALEDKILERMLEGDELTAMLDFEFVAVGDRHVDFAALKTRDTFEQIGDLETFYQLYERRGGRAIDRRRTAFQHIPFVMYAPLEVAEELGKPAAASDHYEYFRWHADGLQTALEDIADYVGLELPPYTPPPLAKSCGVLALEGLAATVDRINTADVYSAYRQEKAGMTARYCAYREAWAPAFQQEYLSDIAELTGQKAQSEWEADAVLEKFVRSAGPELDAPLIRLLFRRARRLKLPVERAGGRIAGTGAS